MDECQDLLPRQLDVLARMCPRLQNNSVAADTAQTIEAGRQFSFKHLKDAFIKNNRAFFEGKVSEDSSEKVKVYHLSHNFRTTQQNCNLNHTVQKLMIFNDHQVKMNSTDWCGQAHACMDRHICACRDTYGMRLCPPTHAHIQRCPREESFQTGSAPVLCCGKDLSEDEFLSAFGVHKLERNQAVLVRSEHHKAELAKQFKWKQPAGGDMPGCVLTIKEAKGGEFEDVLMYDCLTGSTNPCWQIVFAYLRHCAEKKRLSDSSREMEKQVESHCIWLDDQLKLIRKECSAFTRGAVKDEDPDQLVFLQE